MGAAPTTFGAVVRAERRSLGISQEEAVRRARAAGVNVSVQTWRYIEDDERGSYRDPSLRAVEIVLGWAPGQAELVHADPTLEPVRSPAEPDRLTQLERAVQELGRKLDELVERSQPPGDPPVSAAG